MAYRNILGHGKDGTGAPERLSDDFWTLLNVLQVSDKSKLYLSISYFMMSNRIIKIDYFFLFNYLSSNYYHYHHPHFCIWFASPHTKQDGPFTCECKENSQPVPLFSWPTDPWPSVSALWAWVPAQISERRYPTPAPSLWRCGFSDDHPCCLAG